VVAPLFKPLTDRLSLAQLRDYLARRYRLKRVEDRKGNYEYADIGTEELLAFDNRFHSQDIIRFGFRYDASWTAITEFQAELLGRQL